MTSGSSSTRRITAWLAMLVLVLNALMPLAAQAVLASVGQGDTVEICTSTGIVRVPVDQDDNAGKSDATRMQSCPFCLLHGSQAWLPPSSVSVPIPQDHAEMPPAFYQAAVTSAVWLIALSRGPPLILS